MKVALLVFMLALSSCEWGDPKRDNADATAGPDIEVQCAQQAQTLAALPKGVGDTEVEVNCLKRKGI